MEYKHEKVAVKDRSAATPVEVDLEQQAPAHPEIIIVVVPAEENLDNMNDPMIPCAIVGLLFSWIPLVGIITFCFNLDAPMYSMRYKIAQLALVVSCLSLLFNIIFWPARS